MFLLCRLPNEISVDLDKWSNSSDVSHHPHPQFPLTHCRSSGPVCRNLNFFTVTLIFFEAMLQYKMFNMYNLITYLVDIVSYNYVFFPPSWMPQPYKNIESCFYWLGQNNDSGAQVSHSAVCCNDQCKMSPHISLLRVLQWPKREQVVEIIFLSL